MIKQSRHKQGKKPRVKNAPEAASGSSQFQGSRNVLVRGGKFITGARYFTLNFNQDTTNETLDDDEIKSPLHTMNSQSRPGMDKRQHSTPMSPLPSPPTPRGWEIYHKLMVLKGRGTPMKHPGASRSLPDAYRRRGITVGDVGIFTGFGGFDFLFNICLSASHPINQQGLPEGFSSLSPPLRPGDVYIRTEFNKDTYLTSELVKKSYSSNGASEITFESSAFEGAILALPHGADAEDLRNVARFRRYLSSNKVNWYRYVNDIRGREAKNGELQLVVGCDKASSWGMATFANSTAQISHLNFKLTSEGGYAWEYSGMVEASAGPDPEETEQLRATDRSGHSEVYKNQTLFVRTLDATLSDEVWQGLGFDFSDLNRHG